MVQKQQDNRGKHTLMECTAGCLLTDDPGAAPGSGGSGFSAVVKQSANGSQEPLQLFEQVEKRVEHIRLRETQNSKREKKSSLDRG